MKELSILVVNVSIKQQLRSVLPNTNYHFMKGLSILVENVSTKQHLWEILPDTKGKFMERLEEVEVT